MRTIEATYYRAPYGRKFPVPVPCYDEDAEYLKSKGITVSVEELSSTKEIVTYFAYGYTEDGDVLEHIEIATREEKAQHTIKRAVQALKVILKD